MDFYREHILSVITYTPLLGALVLLLPGLDRNHNAVRWIALSPARRGGCRISA